MPAPPQVIAGEFGEPWSIDPESRGTLRNAHGIEVFDSYGTELHECDEEDYAV
jgi:hypothetical protein